MTRRVITLDPVRLPSAELARIFRRAAWFTIDVNANAALARACRFYPHLQLAAQGWLRENMGCPADLCRVGYDTAPVLFALAALVAGEAA